MYRIFFFIYLYFILYFIFFYYYCKYNIINIIQEVEEFFEENEKIEKQLAKQYKKIAEAFKPTEDEYGKLKMIIIIIIKSIEITGKFIKNITELLKITSCNILFYV